MGFPQVPGISVQGRDKPTLSKWFCISWFVAALIAQQMNIGFLIYSAAIAWATFKALRRPIEGLWLLFFTFAVAVMSISLDYDPEFGAEAPRAYLYWGFSIAWVAVAMFAGSVRRPRRFRDERGSGLRALPFLVFLGVVFLAVGYGCLQGNSVATIIRQGSGLIFLFFFIFLGYRLRPSFRELSEGLRNIKAILVAYAGFYLVRVIYLNLAQRFALPEGDFLRERSPILFFCGLFGALEFGRWLFRESSSAQAAKEWFSASLLVASAGLSGSRSIVAAMLLTVVFFLLLRYAAHPLKAALSIAVLLVCAASFNWQGFLATVESQSPFLEHIAERYLVSPDEDFSFLQRSSEMSAVWDGLKSNPILGHGAGATLVWFDPFSREYVETAFVDSGFGYLLLKMGFLGLCTFVALLASLLRRSWRYWKSTNREVFLLILGMLVYYSAFLPFGPSFFQFLFSFWVGILVGWLYLLDGVQALDRLQRDRPSHA